MNSRLTQPRNTGFSLVELSIVLVILGLLVGGVLAGQSLIRAAELRAVTTEYHRYTTSAQAFRDKYMALPGDMPNAQSFWGVAAACPGVAGDERTTTATCNGNGDKQLIRSVATSNETFGFWQHLANAGLIEGTYTGVSNDSTASSRLVVAGTNIPASRFRGGAWVATVPDAAHTIINSNFFIEGDYGNSMLFGGPQDYTRVPVMRAEEAWNIDTKMDDGLASYGKVVVYEVNPACYLLSDGVTAGSVSFTDPRVGVVYNLANSAISCALVFKKAF